MLFRSRNDRFERKNRRALERDRRRDERPARKNGANRRQQIRDQPILGDETDLAQRERLLHERTVVQVGHEDHFRSRAILLDRTACHCSDGESTFLIPSINAARKPGEWQTIDVTLIGRVITVTLNGERIIDRQTIPGITGGALDSEEGKPGPLMVQGDHGVVEFRKLILTPGE